MRLGLWDFAESVCEIDNGSEMSSLSTCSCMEILDRLFESI